MNTTNKKRGMLQRLTQPLRNEFCRLRVRGLKQACVVSVHEFGDHRFHAASGTEIFRTLDYGAEPESLAALLFLLRDQDVVWDIGASVGLMTVHAAARVQHVAAFEPDPRTFDRLKQNVALNGLENRCSFHAVALGETPGTFKLATDGLDGRAPTLAEKGAEHGHHVDVEVQTIDAVVRGGVKSPSVIKMDIEGAEILAIKGAQGLLTNKVRPRLLFLELHPVFLPRFGSSLNEVIELVRSFGYIQIGSQLRGDQMHLIALDPAQA